MRDVSERVQLIKAAQIVMTMAEGLANGHASHTFLVDFPIVIFFPYSVFPFLSLFPFSYFSLFHNLFFLLSMFLSLHFSYLSAKEVCSRLNRCGKMLVYVAAIQKKK